MSSGMKVTVDLSQYKRDGLRNYLSINRISLATLVKKFLIDTIMELDYEDEKYNFDTYEPTSENLNIVKQRLIDKYGSLAEYGRHSQYNADFIYSVFSGDRKIGEKLWIELSYNAGYVKYN